MRTLILGICLIASVATNANVKERQQEEDRFVDGTTIFQIELIKLLEASGDTDLLDEESQSWRQYAGGIVGGTRVSPIKSESIEPLRTGK